MSASNAPRTLVAKSDAGQPELALRQTLSEIARQLGQLGATPAQLSQMVWSASDPGAFHPSRRVIDVAYREVFGGVRPPIRCRRGAEPGLFVEAEVVPQVGSPAGPVWGGFSLAALAREYSPRSQVPDMAFVFESWSREGNAFRQNRKGLDLAYGPGAAETLDLYRPPDVVRPPVWVFIHGGYWQASTKEQHAHLAAGMLRAGYAVANLEYALAPESDLLAITAQVRSALRFLVGEADALDLDAGNLHVAGHSAGGHLAVMAAIDGGGPPVRSALLLSGLFDLAPLAALPIGRLLGLSHAGDVERLSPLRHSPRPGTRIGVAVGGLESAEFKRQSCELAEAWGATPPLIVAGKNHFDLLDGLLGGELLDLAIETARG